MRLKLDRKFWVTAFFAKTTESLRYSAAVECVSVQKDKDITEILTCFIKAFLLLVNRINTPKKQGGLGCMRIPLVSDTNREISKKYGVLKEDEGISYR